MRSYAPATSQPRGTLRPLPAAGLSEKPSAGGLSAFTLLELLVVVAIVGLLASLLLVAVSQSKRKAQQIQCVGNLHQLGIGLQGFVTENHAYPSQISGKNTEHPGMWMDQLERGGFDITKPKLAFFTEGVWRCPAAQLPNLGTNVFPVSYGYNAFGVQPVGIFGDPSLGLVGNYVSSADLYSPLAEGEVVNPSEMMAIGESISGGIDFMRISLAHPPTRERVFARHQGRSNVLFCDGHVESPKVEYVFEDKSDAALRRWNRDHEPHRDRL